MKIRNTKVLSLALLIIAMLSAQSSIAQIPTINSFTPLSGPIGTTVTIDGANFSTTPANNIVWFGAVKATVTAATATSLKVTVPAGATYQPITVTTGGYTAYSTKPFLVTFSSSGVIDATSFDSKVDFTAGTEPISIAIGDIDGDGKSDLTIANYNANTISIYRNNSISGIISSSSLVPKVDLTTGLYPYDVAIGDIDGDGKQDLVVANSVSYSISIFRNISTSGSISTSSFENKVDFTTGTDRPVSIDIGDLDGDGKPDIAFTNYTSNTVSVFRNTSTSGSITLGSFASKVDFNTGLNPYFVAIGDIDGDGKPDLAVSNSSSNTISVFRNISTLGSITTSSFATKIDLITGASPFEVIFGDIDGDDKADLSVVNAVSSNVSVFKNTSTIGSIGVGSFNPKVDFSTGGYPVGVALGDIDGDGKSDLVITNQSSLSVSVLRNTSTTGTIDIGSFETKADFTTGTGPNSVAIGDIDGDGKPDIAVANYNNNTISVLRNTIPSLTSLVPNGGFENATQGSNTALNWNFSAADGCFATYTIVPNPHSGNNSLQADVVLSATAKDNSVQVQHYPPSITLSKAGNYKLSFWAKSSSLNKLNAMINKSNWDYISGITIPTLPLDWQQYSFYFSITSPEICILQFWLQSNGTFWLDDVEIVEVPSVNLTFNVDMSQPIGNGFFKPATDTLYVTGSFANAINPAVGWDKPGTGKSLILTDTNSDNIYTGTVAIPENYGELKYKYFKNASWDYGDNVTGDRTIYISNTDYVIDPPDIWYMTSPIAPLPIDFETGTYTFFDFAGGVTNVIQNPQVNGINTSSNCAQQIRYADQVYAGSKLPLNGFLDFSADPIITMKVFSNRKGVPVVLKAENNDNSQSSGDIIAYTTKSGEWEILVFNFTGYPSGVFNNLTFIFDMGSFGDGTVNSTFLFDDIKFGATELFAGGSGTQFDPYLVSTPEELNSVRQFLGAGNKDVYFRQIANIDLGVYPWYDGQGWEPIGNSINQFYGNYNGNLYNIQGLTISRPDSNFVGLFGRVMEGELTNINLENISVLGNRHVGSIAGQARNNSYIANCRATGNIFGQIFAGGMVASLYFGSTLENCYSLVNVYMELGSNGNQQIGGLVGRLHDNSSIINSFAAGNIDGLSNGAWIGGLVGFVSANSSINNSYATGAVNGGSFVGGLLGAIENSNIANCYSVGRVASVGGGLVANQVGSTITNSYWNIETSAQSTSAGGEPKTTNQFIFSSTFNSWPFGSIWSIAEGATYPYLVWQGSPSPFNYPPAYLPPSNLTAVPHDGYISLAWQAPSIGNPTSYTIFKDGNYYATTSSTAYDDMGLPNYTYYNYYIFADYSGYYSEASNNVSTFAHPGFSAGGDGSASNPYLISNAGELFTIRLYLTSNFRQIANIDLGIYPWNDILGWKPIGSFDVPFRGTYNGDNYSINNLTINRTTEAPVGLFGTTSNGALIEKVILNNASVYGSNYAGALAGDVNNTWLKNIVINNAYISGNSYVGGIAGGIWWSSSIKNSSSSGTINATGNQIGGIAGVNYDHSRIYNSYSSMNINSNGNAVGGLSGTNEVASTISNSYSLGNVYGNEFVGGIVGWMDTSFVTNCYSTSYVLGNMNMGGIAGASFNEAAVTNSYWNTVTSGQTTSAGGEGRTTDEMTYPYSNTYLSWDFNNIWDYDATTTNPINNGYPYLRMLDVDFPTVITYEAESITANSSVVRGNVTYDGGSFVSDRGMVWSTNSNPSIENNSGRSMDGDGIGEFSSTLTNLTPNQLYYARAYATNSNGTGYGNEISFTTLSGGTLPIVSTNPITSITANSAISGGNITSDGGIAITARGVVWSVNQNPSLADNSGYSTNGQGLGAFVSNLTNLTSNKKYYVKAYATNSDGNTGYGNEVSFTTLSGSGTITINGKTAVCEGEKGVTYSIGTDSYTNINWNVTNGAIASGIGTNTIIVDWNNFSSSGIVAVQAVNSNSVAVSNSLNVFFTGSSSYPNPTIHVKGPGKANILICETPYVQYQWYKNNQLMSGETKQYYVAKTNVGQYYVAINDNSGCLAYSETKTITNKKSVNLYPNPATQSTTLSYEAEITGNATIKIRDVFGKTLKQWDWDKPNYQLQEDIPLHELKKGVYMVEVSVDGISQVIEQLIIN